MKRRLLMLLASVGGGVLLGPFGLLMARAESCPPGYDGYRCPSGCNSQIHTFSCCSNHETGCCGYTCSYYTCSGANCTGQTQNNFYGPSFYDLLYCGAAGLCC